VSELEFNVPFQHKHGYIRTKQQDISAVIIRTKRLTSSMQRFIGSKNVVAALFIPSKEVSARVRAWGQLSCTGAICTFVCVVTPHRRTQQAYSGLVARSSELI